MSKKRRYVHVEFMPDEFAERIARILGGGSAARLALDEAKRRRLAGEDVVLLLHGNTILVGPRPQM